MMMSLLLLLTTMMMSLWLMTRMRMRKHSYGCIDESQRIPNTQSARTFAFSLQFLHLLCLSTYSALLLHSRGRVGRSMACLNTCTSEHALLSPILDRLGVGCLNTTSLPPFTIHCGQYWTGWARQAGGGVDCLTLWQRQTQQVLAEIALRSIHQFGNGVSGN